MKHQRYRVFVLTHVKELEAKLNEIGAEPGWRVFQVVAVTQPYYMVIAEKAMSKGEPA